MSLADLKKMYDSSQADWLAKQNAFTESLKEQKAVQIEFLRLAGQKYHYVGFGDTNHANLSVTSFPKQTEVVKALVAAGKKNIFIECSPAKQPYLDHAATGEPVTDETVRKFRDDGFNGWLSAADNKKLSAIFEESARDHAESIRFVGADQRLVNGQLDGMMNSVYARGFLALFCTALINRVTGLLPGFSKKDNLIDKRDMMKIGAYATRSLIDDRQTAAYIKTFPEPAAIQFGAAHWAARTEKQGQERSMRNLLSENDPARLCVINIFSCAADKEKSEEENAFLKNRDADADFIIDTLTENYGIRINNPLLEPLYDQAVSNLRLNKAPAP